MVVVAAVDRSGRSSHVVSEAASLAAAFDEPVHVVHALTRSEFVDLGLTSAQAEKPKDMAEIRSAAAEMAEDAVVGTVCPGTRRWASSATRPKKSPSTPTNRTRATSW
nr:universal stress protein [Haloferax sp. ATB1]